ncbi:MAG: glutamate synthase subunit beta [Candidatus Margulisbacteria bacterium]|nr:glutamate synthase subunit beta [Candidatus Margulisiibacteriota bacterium]
MGNPKGFLKIKREAGSYRPVCERVKDYSEVFKLRKSATSRDQASRCMDCGVPFCHWACPLANVIPEWNDLVFNNHWERAFELLSETNILPEVTGRVCPALCEAGCVLGVNDEPVTIRENELDIVEYAFKKGLIKPNLPKKRSGKKVAIVGSGPAGLSCAVHLNKLGHSAVVFERDKKIGGLMRFGIPDFKLDKAVLDRRIDIWKKEGIIFETGVNVGVDYPAKKILKKFDAVCLAGGARVPRDLNIPGRKLSGIHLAMDYLTKKIDSKGKRVVVIGGGDTGSDCVGTANRRGAGCVVQIEVMPEPPTCRDGSCPWPTYPKLLKTTSSHEEGAKRRWSVLTREFVGEKGKVQKLICESTGEVFEIEADLVILAIGFVGAEPVKGLDPKQEGVFCAGDMRRGQSLIVWALYEGRQVAEAINKYLRGGK